MVKKSSLQWLMLGALALTGCGSSQAPRQPTTSEPAANQTAAAATPDPGAADASGEMAEHCPMQVSGTTARAEDVEGGAAIVFTTSGDVAELRRRVAHMAEMHERRGGEAHGRGMGMMGGPHSHAGQSGEAGGPAQQGASPGGMGMRGRMMPPATARSEAIEGGARLVLTPRDPADLTRLREHVAQHSQMMEAGHCPMMALDGHERTSSARAAPAGP